MDTQNDGLEKVDSLKIWPFLAFILDFYRFYISKSLASDLGMGLKPYQSIISILNWTYFWIRFGPARNSHPIKILSHSQLTLQGTCRELYILSHPNG